MLGLLLVALAVASPIALPLFVAPVLLTVIICWFQVIANSPIRPIQGIANPQERINTAMIKPIRYEDLFMSELIELDSTLSQFLATIMNLLNLRTLAHQESNRVDSFDTEYGHDADYALLRDQRHDGCLDFKLFCNVILLTLYLLFSAGLWRLLVASVRACLSSVSQPCLLFCAPARNNGIAMGCVSMFVLGVHWTFQRPDDTGIIVLPILTCVGAWFGSIAKALCFATMELALAHIHEPEELNHPNFEQLFWCQLLPQGQQLLSPHQCRYSQDSISSRFRDGHEVTERRQIQQYTITACFHEGELLTLNNRTLYSAVVHNIWPIRVTIVEKPTTWSSRFTARSPWTSIQVRRPQSSHPLAVIESIIEQANVLEAAIVPHIAYHAALVPMALVIPADAFPGTHQVEGHVVLEVNSIVNPRQPQADTLVVILRTRCPGFNIEEVEGDRSFARARIRMADEAVVRAVIKAVGRERRKRVTISEVRGSRVFLSPRD